MKIRTIENKVYAVLITHKYLRVLKELVSGSRILLTITMELKKLFKIFEVKLLVMLHHTIFW